MQYIDCSINPISRQVSYPGAVIVQRDTNVEALRFHYSLQAEHELENDSIRVMVNTAKEIRGFNAENVRIETNDGGDEELVFEHTITRYETEVPGQINVSVCGNQISGDTITEAWHTLNMSFQVGSSVHTDSDEGEDSEETKASNAEKIAALRTLVDAITSGRPIPVDAKSKMTDTSAIYLYTGNETGEQHNYWYYHDGTTWVPGSEYGGITIDDELSSTSENAVQNKVIKAKYDELNGRLQRQQGIIAEAFSAQSTYDVGDSVIYEAGLYTFKADKSAGAWDATKVDGPFKVTEQISNLKEDLKSNTKNTLDDEIIPITGLKQFISLDNETADVNTPTANSNYNYWLVNCTEGDVFTLNCYAGQPRAYGFVAENGTVLSKAGRGYTAVDLVVTAPANAHWLVVNDSSNSGMVYKSIVFKKRFETFQTTTQSSLSTLRNDVDGTASQVTNIDNMVHSVATLMNDEDKKNYALVNNYQLWDKFKVVSGEYVLSDGTVVQNPDWIHLTIFVDENVTYLFATPDPSTPTGVKTGSAGYIALINGDGSYYDNSPTAHQWDNSLTIPVGVVQMTVSIPKSRLYDSEEYSIIAVGSPTNTKTNKWSPRYKNFIQEYKGSTYKISCIGDSLTAGAGGSGVSYPTVLANNNENLEVNSFAFPSEDSLYIASAVGGMRVYVDPFTIPASNSANSAPTITIKQDNNNTYVMDHVASDNLCKIGNVLGLLKYENGVNKFQRLVNGDEVILNHKEPLYQCFELKHIGDITIIWAGTNDKTISSMEEAVFYHIDNIINLLPHKKYLVLGIMQNIKFSNITSIITYYRRHYGSHFVNIRQYLLDYGLSDAGITPTETDITDISNGTIPTSLRSDETHLNAVGYTVVGNYLYKLISDLGWLNE